MKKKLTPKIVERMITEIDWESTDRENIRFATLEELIAENTEWLEENVVIPEELRTGIELSRLKNKRFVYEKIG